MCGGKVWFEMTLLPGPVGQLAERAAALWLPWGEAERVMWGDVAGV